VVGEFVPAFRDLRQQVGMLRGAGANHEEGGPVSARLEQIEQCGRPSRIRPVVEGECELRSSGVYAKQRLREDARLLTADAHRNDGGQRQHAHRGLGPGQHAPHRQQRDGECDRQREPQQAFAQTGWSGRQIHDGRI
jgi:hypothetical protein